MDNFTVRLNKAIDEHWKGTYLEFAKKCDIRVTELNQYLFDGRIPLAPTINTMAAVLGVSAEYLFKGDKTMEWNMVKKDGNPKKAGTYLCVLLYDEYWDGKLTGEKKATIDFRWFGDAAGNEGWIMVDQPKEGLVWTEQCGSSYEETVYAWREVKAAEMPELPEGYTYDETLY